MAAKLTRIFLKIKLRFLENSMFRDLLFYPYSKLALNNFG